MSLTFLYKRAIALFLFLFIISCTDTEKTNTSNKNLSLWQGRWRATLRLQESQELPFNFDLKYKNGQYEMIIYNADEKIVVNDFTFDHDSVFIRLPIYNAELRGKFNQKRILGAWYNYGREVPTNIPFYAVHGDSSRFIFNVVDSIPNVGGKWEVTFITGDKSSKEDAIGEFEQNGTHLTATFRTPTGDYRYLEGCVTNNEILLSAFDGSHAFLLQGNLTEYGDIEGDFYSGSSYFANWIAFRNDTATLPTMGKLSYLKNPQDAVVHFALPNLEGKTVSLSDAEFKNKVVLVQLMGSWCPNCYDESRFLVDIAQKYGDKIAIVALAFEPSGVLEKERPNLLRYKKQIGIDYPILLAGKNKKQEASKLFPQLNGIEAFPTLLVIDKTGKVRDVHSGFEGPATSQYVSFTKEFTKIIENLLAEPSKSS